MTIVHFFKYLETKPGSAAVFKGIPMSDLKAFKSVVPTHGQKFRIRYRGPRFNIPTDNRPRDLKRSTCLKANATTFSVY